MATHINTYSVQDAAKLIGIGSKKLFKYLREQNVLNKNNVPYQSYIDNGYLKVEASNWNHPTVGTKLYAKTVVTVKGVEWLQKKINPEHQVINHEQSAEPTESTEHRRAV